MTLPRFVKGQYNRFHCLNMQHSAVLCGILLVYRWRNIGSVTVISRKVLQVTTSTVPTFPTFASHSATKHCWKSFPPSSRRRPAFPPRLRASTGLRLMLFVLINRYKTIIEYILYRRYICVDLLPCWVWVYSWLCSLLSIFGDFFASCISSEPRAARFRPAF